MVAQHCRDHARLPSFTCGHLAVLGDEDEFLFFAVGCMVLDHEKPKKKAWSNSFQEAERTELSHNHRQVHSWMDEAIQMERAYCMNGPIVWLLLPDTCRSIFGASGSLYDFALKKLVPLPCSHVPF